VSETRERWQGRRFVLLFYVTLVALAGVFGYIIGLIRPESLNPRLFMLVPLPPTPLGMALYGSLTVGVALGVLLVVVRYVAREFDTADPG
jgi:hypothetical protein